MKTFEVVNEWKLWQPWKQMPETNTLNYLREQGGAGGGDGRVRGEIEKKKIKQK